jgi:hypothetical protein
LADLKTVIAVGVSRARAKAGQPTTAPGNPPAESGSADYKNRYGLD